MNELFTLRKLNYDFRNLNTVMESAYHNNFDHNFWINRLKRLFNSIMLHDRNIDSLSRFDKKNSLSIYNKSL